MKIHSRCWMLMMMMVLIVFTRGAVAQEGDCSGRWQRIPHYRPERGAPCTQLGLDARRGTCLPGQRYETLCDDHPDGRYRTCQGPWRCDRRDGDHRGYGGDRRWHDADDDHHRRFDDPPRWNDDRREAEPVDFCRLNGPLGELHGPRHHRIDEIRSQIQWGRLAMERDRDRTEQLMRQTRSHWERRELQHDFETRRECFESWREQMERLREDIEGTPERPW